MRGCPSCRGAERSVEFVLVDDKCRWNKNCHQGWHGTGAEETDGGVQSINPADRSDLSIFRVAESRQILNCDNRKILKAIWAFF